MQNEATHIASDESRIRKVLVVDDDRDNAKLLTILLGLKAYSVETAFDGQEAIDKFESFRPDVVLLDLGCLESMALKFARALEEVSSAKGTVMIAQSGWVQSSDRQRAHTAGFDFFLSKPTETQELLDVLRFSTELPSC